MQDIKLDFINKKMLNEYTDKKDRVVQQIIVACRSWLGDFFWNEFFGVDYDNSWGNSQLMELYIKQQVLEIKGVSSINKIEIKKIKDINFRDKFVLDLSIIYNKEEISISDIILGR